MYSADLEEEEKVWWCCWRGIAYLCTLFSSIVLFYT